MRGKTIDMDILRKKNELVPAVGNARVNARGDELGPNGTIVRKREDIIREYYERNPNAMRDEIGGFTPPKKEKQPELVTEQDLTQHEKEMLAEDQEWTEDESGNFVKKTATRSTEKPSAKRSTNKS